MHCARYNGPWPGLAATEAAAHPSSESSTRSLSASVICFVEQYILYLRGCHLFLHVSARLSSLSALEGHYILYLRAVISSLWCMIIKVSPFAQMCLFLQPEIHQSCTSQFGKQPFFLYEFCISQAVCMCCLIDNVSTRRHSVFLQRWSQR